MGKNAEELEQFLNDKGVIMDSPVWTRPNGRVRYCHLTASDMSTLETLALYLKNRVQQKRTRPHIDVPEWQVESLVKLGVKVVSPSEVLKLCKELALGTGIK